MALVTAPPSVSSILDRIGDDLYILGKPRTFFVFILYLFCIYFVFILKKTFLSPCSLLGVVFALVITTDTPLPVNRLKF